MVKVKRTNYGLIRMDNNEVISENLKNQYYKFLADEDCTVIRKQFRTTPNAEIINVYYDDEIQIQFVKSYNTFVAKCTKDYIVYTGFISQTTLRHMLRFFKEYCKFNFAYDNISVANRVKNDSIYHLI